MSNNNVVDIHGKKYLTVAGRVQLAHEGLTKELSISTEMVRASDKGILFKATIKTPKGEFTGHSYAAFTAMGITGQSPVEVAETSAIGRALGFAGYGIVEGMATADEVHKSEAGISKVSGALDKCSDCGITIPASVFKYSTEVLGKALCYSCQKKVKEDGEIQKEVERSGLLEKEESNDLPF